MFRLPKNAKKVDDVRRNIATEPRVGAEIDCVHPLEWEQTLEACTYRIEDEINGSSPNIRPLVRLTAASPYHGNPSMR